MFRKKNWEYTLQYYIASASANDVALISKKTTNIQVQVNMANTFAGIEGYKLQPIKVWLLTSNPSH